jgi:hypothetical protein
VHGDAHSAESLDAAYAAVQQDLSGLERTFDAHGRARDAPDVL